MEGLRATKILEWIGASESHLGFVELRDCDRVLDMAERLLTFRTNAEMGFVSLFKERLNQPRRLKG